MSYGQNAIVMNEFLDERWSTPNTDPTFSEPTVGKVLLSLKGFYAEEYWFWICIGALLGFSTLFNVLFITALTYLNPLGNAKTVVSDDDDSQKTTQGTSGGANKDGQQSGSPSRDHANKKGIPFQPLSLVFNHMNYSVDMPAEMKGQGAEGDRLQLLQGVSGAFRPGVLTALVGVSGAGKTTLMDVLAGRKTGGYIEGSITISGYPKNQATFARISGYLDVKDEARKAFVEEVMELVELKTIRNSLVGLPGVDGLSTEQRKRLTIAVELVANPSIIFMDEPTSGLDARAAAIVMRTVRNTVDTGRTVVCTIHQPSIDIFEAFDELLLMKRGGRIIYFGALGPRSQKLIEYFEAIPGVPKIKEGYNPATWMLEVSTTACEAQLGVDFAELYTKSSLYQKNQELIKELSTPPPGSLDLHFPTKYSHPFLNQCRACFWKQFWSYWRNPQYNAIRFFMTIMIGLVFGFIFLGKGQNNAKLQDLQNLLGAIYAAILFLGSTNCSAVQGIVSIERTVFYRESAAGMYSALPYAFAQVAVEIIYIAIQSALYALILFSMMGLEWTAAKFFWFYYFIFACFVYFTLFGMMLIALTPGLHVGAIIAGFFMSFWNLFSGFLIPRPQTPIWWRWYYWGSPVAWTIYGLFESQIGGTTFTVEIPGVGEVPVSTYLEGYLGYEYASFPLLLSCT
ncbi:UNVERIFIED_CONTAM: ABC transporter G family member 34 [Sesamum latifolium]|uniref:ABC transporter G family member 34 n=1 Tax=Sesamum latifolium TaxID=2727402 RepID=A0AAW2VAT2_9LAMI